MKKYVIGVDYGTNSVRAIVADCADGATCGEGVFNYPHDDNGVVINPADVNVARQHPQDYLDGLKYAVKAAEQGILLAGADEVHPGFKEIGII